MLDKYWQTSSNANHWKLMEKLLHQCQCRRTQLRLHFVWILLVLIWDYWRWCSYGWATNVMSCATIHLDLLMLDVVSTEINTSITTSFSTLESTVLLTGVEWSFFGKVVLDLDKYMQWVSVLLECEKWKCESEAVLIDRAFENFLLSYKLMKLSRLNQFRWCVTVR